MSQWVHSPNNISNPPEVGPTIGPMEGGSEGMPQEGFGSKGPFREHGAPEGAPESARRKMGNKMQRWNRFLPYFLSAFFFLNGFRY